MRLAEERAKGVKVSDCWCVPLCFTCHDDLHRFGDEETWWALKGLDPVAWAKESWTKWNS